MIDEDATKQNMTGQSESGASGLEALVGYNLKRAYIVVSNDFRKTVGRDGFGSREFALMSLVVKFPHITQSSLARMLGIERSGLVAIVDKLENQTFLKRVPVPGDRRAQALVASSKGIAAYNDAVINIRQHEDDLLASLTLDERDMLVSLLRKVRVIGE